MLLSPKGDGLEPSQHFVDAGHVEKSGVEIAAKHVAH
jgi:hypothetical protein